MSRSQLWMAVAGRASWRPALSTLALLLVSFRADANLIVNGSFESGPDPGARTEHPTGSTAITGWVVAGNPIDYVGTDWNASEGVRSLALNGTNPGGISTTFATFVGAPYTVTFYMAGDAFSFPTLKHVQVSAAGVSESYEHDASHAWPWDLGWLQRTFNFTAVATSTTLTFMSLDPETTGPTLDDVVVTGPGSSAVPEIPGSGLTLAPPSPNPASGGVWLNFEVPEASPVRLSVCDIQGREIHLIAEGLLAGRQSRYWDGTTARGRMPAGLYLIRLATPAATLVRKVLLTH